MRWRVAVMVHMIVSVVVLVSMTVIVVMIVFMPVPMMPVMIAVEQEPDAGEIDAKPHHSEPGGFLEMDRHRLVYAQHRFITDSRRD